mmetsp:Transcript_2524/g.7408  ORF Transcript_2524/g.7408 Transcript_2524/m.7408 type:complete len:201 (-) Transcript_2524:44-646(-)
MCDMMRRAESRVDLGIDKIMCVYVYSDISSKSYLYIYSQFPANQPPPTLSFCPSSIIFSFGWSDTDQSPSSCTPVPTSTTSPCAHPPWYRQRRPSSWWPAPPGSSPTAAGPADKRRRQRRPRRWHRGAVGRDSNARVCPLPRGGWTGTAGPRRPSGRGGGLRGPTGPWARRALRCGATCMNEYYYAKESISSGYARYLSR